MVNKLVNKTELSRLLGTKRKITTKEHPEKYNAVIKELNDLIEYWKKRNNL